jgi:hypothetical protein
MAKTVGEENDTEASWSIDTVKPNEEEAATARSAFTSRAEMTASFVIERLQKNLARRGPLQDAPRRGARKGWKGPWPNRYSPRKPGPKGSTNPPAKEVWCYRNLSRIGCVPQREKSRPQYLIQILRHSFGGANSIEQMISLAAKIGIRGISEQFPI